MRGDRHIRIGSARIQYDVGASILDAADSLASIARVDLRQLRDDPRLRDEAIRRVLSPPCPTRCYVSGDGARHDCTCPSGFQWTTDPEAQALEGCPPRDVWSDIRALLAGHHAAGRGPHDPIACDCDDLTPTSIAVAGYLAWFAPETLSVSGFSDFSLEGTCARCNMGAAKGREPRFAVGITLPPPLPGKERIGHAYGLVSYKPQAPQPEIKMPYKDGDWWVWDASAHFGMARPANDFYTSGEYVAVEVRRDALDGLR